MDWQNEFIGRADDLKVLQNAFEEARSGKTRVVAIVSESGFGKTRLAQEFYNWLSINHDGVEADGYWPDRLLREADNLRVNPDLGDCGGIDKKMPFLWWGLRLSDPGRRNVTSASGALQAGIEILQAHLAEYERELQRIALKNEQILGGSQTAIDIAISVGETALDAFGNMSTFGLLGIGKAAFKAGSKHSKASKEISDLDRIDVRPAAAAERARDTLGETVVGDLFRLCKAPPKGFEPIPIVIVVDDAQWLETDGGMESFLRILLDQARTQDWPLLVVVTSWRREWLSSAAARKVPGKLMIASVGDVVLDLGGVEGLETIIPIAFPGLTDCQVAALSEKAEGVPRLLDEMLLYLGRRRKLFVERDPSKRLTDVGLVEVLSKDFASFVADRLEEAPEHVRRALAIASAQGVNFSPRLVRRIAEGLMIVDAEAGLQEGEDPHSFVVGIRETTGGEFRLRAYQTAAREDLGNLLDELEVEDGLQNALEELARDPSAATNGELALVLDGPGLLDIEETDWTPHIIDAGTELIQRARATFDARTAGEVSNRILPLFDNDTLRAKRTSLLIMCDAFLEWNGPSAAIKSTLSSLVEFMRGLAEEEQTLGTTRDLAVALGRLGGVVEALDGPGAARHLREEEERIQRALAEEHPTPSARRDFAVALANLGSVVEALDGPGAARHLREEEERIQRALAEEQPTPGARRDLAFALGDLGGIVEVLDGPGAARPLCEEMVELVRALAEEQPTLGTKRDLAVALGLLGGVVGVLDGPGAARPLCEEMVELMHALADENPTPGARRDLAVALGRLGGLVEALDGPGAALHLREEEERIQRALAEGQQTPGAKRDLAIALGRLGDIIEVLDGPDVARTLRGEAVQIMRALAEERPAPGIKRDFAMSLGRLGGLVEELDGPAVARPLREEEERILRVLAEEQPTSGARRDLAIALGSHGDLVDELDGPAAARPLREEEERILRALAEEQSTLDARRDLAMALGRLGDIIEALDGPGAARPLYGEMVELMRVLAEEQPTPGARRDLAISLRGLGGLVEALDGPGAARPLYEEMIELMRALAEEQPTLGARRDLAISLAYFGGIVEALDGLGAARPVREEEERIQRLVSEEQPTPGAKRELAIALANLGGVVEAVDGPGAARPLIEEMVELLRQLAEEQPTPGAKRELAIALANLGGVVEALDGLVAARPLREEMVELMRALAEEQSLCGIVSELIFTLKILHVNVEALDDHESAKSLNIEIKNLEIQLNI